MTNFDRQEKFFGILKPNLEKLERFALALCRNRQDAKDITGETILTAYDNYEKLREEKAFLSFIFTIASRIYYRNIGQGRKMISFEDAGILYCNRLSPETSADVQLLYDALGRLPEEQRQAIILSEIFGFLHKEIAEIQGCGLSSVKMRIFRGKKKLGRFLGVENKKDLLDTRAAALI